MITKRAGAKKWSGLVLMIMSASVAVAETGEVRVETSAAPNGSTVVVAVAEYNGEATRQELWRGKGEISVLSGDVDVDTGLAIIRFDVGSQAFYSVSSDTGRTWSAGRPFRRWLGLGATRVMPDDAMPAVPVELRQPGGGELYVVQFKIPSVAGCRASLGVAGARIVASLPPNAHIVTVSPGRVHDLEKLLCVERVEPFHPGYRLEPELLRWLQRSGEGREPRRIHAIVSRSDREAKGRLAHIAEAQGIPVAPFQGIGSTLTLDVRRDQLVALARSDDFLWANALRPRNGSADVAREHTGANWAEQPEHGGTCGGPVRLEVMDCYLQWDHQDFLSDLPIIHGSDPADHLDDGDPTTDNIRDNCIASGEEHHGTSVYGIVLSDGSSDPEPSAYQPGEGKSRGMLPCGQGIFTSWWDLFDDVANTADLVDPNGTSCDGGPCLAAFSNRSIGDFDGEYNTWSYQADEGIWKSDFSIVQCMGNWGRTGTPTHTMSEAQAKNNVTVGGIHQQDPNEASDDHWCSHVCTGLGQTECEADPSCAWNSFLGRCFDDYDTCASRGPAIDGRIKPDVSLYYKLIRTPKDVGHGSFTGTSAATPQVAGVLGLILEAWRDNAWGNCATCGGQTVFEARPTPAAQKALLINSAEQWTFSAEGQDLDRYRQGWGRPSIRAARQRAIASHVIDQGGPIQAGEVFSKVIEVTDQDLKVTLVYTDPPAVPPAVPALLNDLDLRVISPSGEIYCGNFGLTSSMLSTPIASVGHVDCFDTIGGTVPAPRDALNNVENVFVDGAEPGAWTIEIEAVTIAEDQAVTGGCDVHADQGACETAGCTWGVEFCGDGVADVQFALVTTWSDCPDVPGGLSPPTDPQTLMVDKAPDGISVAVSWNASPETYVTGYNVNRMSDADWLDRSQVPTAWTRIRTTAGTAITDDAPFHPDEHLFFYDVRAVDEYCRESERTGSP